MNSTLTDVLSAKRHTSIVVGGISSGAEPKPRKAFAQGFAHLWARVQVCPASKGGDDVGDANVRGA